MRYFQLFFQRAILMPGLNSIVYVIVVFDSIAFYAKACCLNLQIGIFRHLLGLLPPIMCSIA